VKTRSSTLLIVVVLTALGAAPALASTVTVDENGHGFFDSTPFSAFLLDPLGLGLGYALPFVAVSGTLFISPSVSDGVGGCVVGAFGFACDVVTFDGTNKMFFASAAAEGSDSLADLTALPSSFTNPALASEVGPEGANGATYTPALGQPGFDPSGPPITYNFVSDGVATPTPEPNTLVLFGTGILGTLGIVGIRGKTRLSS
jgi:hypothetical protein